MMRDEPLRAHIEALVRAGTVRRKTAAAQLEAEIRRREEVLRQTFRRYVSPKVADKILEDSQLRNTLLSTADVRAHVVVLFADLRGFTSIAEQLEASDVVPLLNEYFSLLTEITFRHEGTVFHMAGDCLMLAFGVPLEQPDSAQRAVRAAREMLTGFNALAASWKERYQVDAGLGIGIAGCVDKFVPLGFAFWSVEPWESIEGFLHAREEWSHLDIIFSYPRLILIPAFFMELFDCFIH